MRRISTLIAATAAGILGATTAQARCTKLAFSVNDYGKDGPTRDAKSGLDTYVAKWAAERGIKKYTTGTKAVSCELYIDVGIFDEHTCKAEALVCWDGTATSGAPKIAVAPVGGALTAPRSSAPAKAAPLKATPTKTAPATAKTGTAPTTPPHVLPTSPLPTVATPAEASPITTGSLPIPLPQPPATPAAPLVPIAAPAIPAASAPVSPLAQPAALPAANTPASPKTEPVKVE